MSSTCEMLMGYQAFMPQIPLDDFELVTLFSLMAKSCRCQGCSNVWKDQFIHKRGAKRNVTLLAARFLLPIGRLFTTKISLATKVQIQKNNDFQNPIVKIPIEREKYLQSVPMEKFSVFKVWLWQKTKNPIVLERRYSKRKKNNIPQQISKYWLDQPTSVFRE